MVRKRYIDCRNKSTEEQIKDFDTGAKILIKIEQLQFLCALYPDKWPPHKGGRYKKDLLIQKI